MMTLPGPVARVPSAPRRHARSPKLSTSLEQGGPPLAAPGPDPSTSSTKVRARHAESTHLTPQGPPSGRTTGLSQQALGPSPLARSRSGSMNAAPTAVLPAPYGYASTVTREPARRDSARAPRTRSRWRPEVLFTWQWCIAAPVSAAARTTSADPSTGVAGSTSTSSRTWVNVGTPARAARRATARNSAGSLAGAYPMRMPMPRAPPASSSSSRESQAASSRGVEERCQRGSPSTSMLDANRASGVRPVRTWARAPPQEAEKP